MKHRWAILLACLLTAATCFADGGPPVLSFSVTPGTGLPMGDSAGVFSAGGETAIEAAVDLQIPDLIPFLALRASFQANIFPFDGSTRPLPFSSVTGYSIMLGASGTFPVVPWLSLAIDGSGGYYVQSAGAASSAFGPVVDTGLGLLFGAGAYVNIGAFFSIGLRASYEWLVGLYQGVNFDANLALHIPFRSSSKARLAGQAPASAGKAGPAAAAQSTAVQEEASARAAIEASSVEFFNVFPVFYKYYSNHALGRITLTNKAEGDVTDVKVSFFIKQYMDNPSYSQTVPLLAAGKEVSVDLYGLFKNSILEISEPTLLSSNITVEYTQAGQSRHLDMTQNVRVQDRNALTWQDDRGAAAFVTAKDPTVLKFGKNVSSAVKGKASKALNQPLLTAIGIHEALRAYGLAYVVDPARPFDKMYQNKDVIDFLQFPAQTLDYKAGDCDDLSILYCALLESVNVETAFITIPGHIYMAFSTGMNPADARKFFLKPDDLIYASEKSWIPVEITERDGDFLKAWAEGAQEWRENQAKGQAKILPIQDCWQGFEAVGFSGSTISLPMPGDDTIAKAFLAEVDSFVSQEIYPRVNTLQAEIRTAKDPTKSINKLGVLYAQYGQYDLAEKQFSSLAAKDYVPALINLGNIYYSRNDLRKALNLFQRAQAKEPQNAKALLNVARVNHDLENYGEVKLAYDALKNLDPALAAQFTYLDLRGEESSRAADIGQAKSIMLWEDAP